MRPEDLEADDRALLEQLAQQENVEMVPMSNLSEEGVMKVKEKVSFVCARTLTLA